MSMKSDSGANHDSELSAEAPPTCIPADQDGERLDRFLARHFPDESRASLQRWIKSGRVTSQRKLKASTKLTLGETVTIVLPAPPPPPAPLQAENIDIELLYQDNDIVVVNKAPGLTVHPGPGQQHNTLVHALLYLGGNWSTLGGDERPGIVHRLDKETSGVIVVARNDLAHRRIAAQFKERQTDKTYVALVHGSPPDEGTVNKPLGRHLKDRKKQAIRYDSGRHAVSHFTVVERFANIAALVQVKIETGRTHQIRVHMASLGHGVVGDKFYGRARHDAAKNLIDRHALHARKLCITHPGTQQPICFEAPIPEDIENACQRLRELCAQ